LLQWTAYVFYTFDELATNEFLKNTFDSKKQFYDCSMSDDSENSACKKYIKQYIMKSFEFSLNWIMRSILILFAFVIAFYIEAELILQYWKMKMNIFKT
jgi:hypothetical protein